MQKEKITVKKLSSKEAVSLYKTARYFLNPLKECGKYIIPLFVEFLFAISGVSVEGLEQMLSAGLNAAAEAIKKAAGFRYEGCDYIDVSGGAEQEIYEMADISLPEIYGAEIFARFAMEEAQNNEDWSIVDVCDRIDKIYEGLGDGAAQARTEMESLEVFGYSEPPFDARPLTDTECVCYAKCFSDAVREVHQGAAVEATYLSAFYECTCCLDSSYRYRPQDFVEKLDALLIKFYNGWRMPFSVPGNTKLNEYGIPVQVYEYGCAATESYVYPRIGELYQILHQLPDTEEVEAFRWACEVMSMGKYLYGFPVLDKLNCAVPDDEGGVLFQQCYAEACTESAQISTLAGASIADLVAPLVIHALADDLTARYVKKAA